MVQERPVRVERRLSAIRRFRALAKSSDNPAFLAGVERIHEGMRLAGIPEG
jgi:hypothetical protein